MVRSLARSLIPVALLLVTAGTAHGQVVRGQVIENMSGSEVGGGFVVLTGPDGKEIGRTLADARGRFQLRAPGPGRYMLRSERIGFRVAVSPPFDIAANETVDRDLRIAAVAIRLDEINVTGENQCKVQPEDGRATALVWAEAKKALTAVAWTQRQSQLLRVSIRSFQRDLQHDFTVKSESTTVKSGFTNQPFHARPAAELASLGYVLLAPDSSYTFYAPDATVLFSDSFLNTHCLRARRGDLDHPGQVGLAFEPVRKRPVADIKGTMWLDEKNAELETVEYQYVNTILPGPEEDSGGRVEFQQLVNGAWVVSYFVIRMPVFGVTSDAEYSAFRVEMGNSRRVNASGGGRTVVDVVGFREEGGELLDVFDREGNRLPGASSATLAGTVFDSTRMAPLQYATVRLAGTNYATQTGPGGTFRMDRLPDGMYAIEFHHDGTPAWGIFRPAARVTLKHGQVTQTLLAVPPAPRLLAELCPGMARDSGLGAAGGRVTDLNSGMGVADVRVQFTWKQFGISAAGSAAAVDTRAEGLEIATDSTGLYRICGLPWNTPISAEAAIGRSAPMPVEFKLDKGELKEVNLVIQKKS